MCVVSLVADHYGQQWGHASPGSLAGIVGTQIWTSKFEFDALKKEVETMKALLVKAKIYDEQTNQKDCEKEEKIKMLKQIAELVGISLDDVFPKVIPSL